MRAVYGRFSIVARAEPEQVLIQDPGHYASPHRLQQGRRVDEDEGLDPGQYRLARDGLASRDGASTGWGKAEPMGRRSGRPDQRWLGMDEVAVLLNDTGSEVRGVTEERVSSSHSVFRSKRRVAALILVAVCTCAYLIGVLLAAYTRSTAFFFPEGSRAAVARGQLSDHCRQVLERTSLNGPGPSRPPHFREFGNLWYWESAKTGMYSPQLLHSPECLGSLLNVYSMAAPVRSIVVIFDVDHNRPLLVIRNFE